MNTLAPSDWQKGGLRYAKLKQLIPEMVAPASVRAFFVAVHQRGGAFRLFNPLSPLQREYVVVATDGGVTVLWLRRPGVFRASVGGVIFQGSNREAEVDWSDGRMLVAGTAYEPIAFHSEDAEELARLVTESANHGDSTGI